MTGPILYPLKPDNVSKFVFTSLLLIVLPSFDKWLRLFVRWLYASSYFAKSFFPDSDIPLVASVDEFLSADWFASFIVLGLKASASDLSAEVFIGSISVSSH